MSKAVVFFAEGTEECEALLVVDLLRRGKIEVVVASASGSLTVTGSHKVTITADALAEDVDYSDVDLVVLPGGIPGTPNLAANSTVTSTVKAFAEAGKKVAAICAAPSILADLGLLEGKKATSHFTFQDKLTGAVVLDQEVVVDGNITTSYGLGGAIPFGLELVRQLVGPDEAARVQKAIAYKHSLLYKTHR
ncbi:MULTISPECIES: DJ-1 family glyoxalase III [unclassified Faecalibacterium]|uniref:DJ-1 family glyoxalase III n=1 Tax=unclassified Faecalibacterium TaxID=2646395 RepID=UPI000B3695F9|nr:MULTISPECIES: DJ-1 family glyoxalase III [unclassified Faecalibacterium]OUN33216.1 DJ-1 family protein [Faecalibacterium sp. An77]OUP28907.1 DJ-1 family protein [Faecalibacterium sp. An192]OUQ37449.1 DJ-1 family protein [Faecalibacterium sp. An122]